jgi:hypothetical protein
MGTAFAIRHLAFEHLGVIDPRTEDRDFGADGGFVRSALRVVSQFEIGG